jgi:hypothetical protein
MREKKILGDFIPAIRYFGLKVIYPIPTHNLMIKTGLKSP